MLPVLSGKGVVFKGWAMVDDEGIDAPCSPAAPVPDSPRRLLEPVEAAAWDAGRHASLRVFIISFTDFPK
jgi:hypothetical protein